MNSLLSERVAVLASKTAACTSVAALQTTPVKVAPNFRRCALVALTGDMAAETIDVSIHQATLVDLTGDASLKAATQLAAHATNNDNKCIIINLRQSEIVAAKPFISGYAITGSTTGGVMSLTLLGIDERHGPLSSFDSAAVVEIVS